MKYGIKNKEMYVTMETILMEAKIEKDPLFLAIEQGAGKIKNNLNIVINPHTRVKTRTWIVEEYPCLILKETKLMRTSVLINDISVNKQYKERLQDFLRLTLEYAIENKNKKIGKNLKTYAQAVGVKVIQKENTTNQGKQNEGNNNSKNKNNKIKGLEQTIKNMEKQITQLKEIIAEVCDKIVQDEGFKRNIENQLKTVEEY